MRIGDIVWGVKADWNEFEGELSKRGTKAGEKLGADVGKGFNVGKVAVGLFSTAAAGAFAMAAKGAADLERVQGNYAAATGASTEEAKKFAAQVNGMRGSNTQSLEAIAAAGTQVAQQFKLTGDAGKELTQDFLNFSKVTRQDAAGAVDSFDAALDAFGEPASRAVGLMDQLVASNQKFGTDAGPAALSALQGMAPALKALNGGLDDGVGLLNLFEAAGMDASAAQRGLNSAVKNLPPGSNLDDVIAKLGAIEDPALRAQEAIKIFGGRSGVGLANAIKPGMTSLDDFKVNVSEVAGTADKAAEGMLTTSDKFGMFFEDIKSKAAAFGQDFGPLMMGVSSVGSLFAPVAKGIGGVLLRLARDAGILGAATAAGAAQGAAMAGGEAGASGALGAFKSRMIAGLPLAIGAVGAALVAGGTLLLIPWALGRISPDALNQNRNKQQMGEAWASVIPGNAKYVDGHFVTSVEVESDFHISTLGDLGRGLQEADPEIVEPFDEAGYSAGEHFGAAAVEAIPKELADADMHNLGLKRLSMMWRAMGEEAGTEAGAVLPGALAASALDASSTLDSDLDRLRQIIKDKLSPKGLAKQAGWETMKEVQAGLADGSPFVVDQARLTALDAIRAISVAGMVGDPSVGGGAAYVGKYIDRLLASGMDEDSIRVALAGMHLSNEAIDGIMSVKGFKPAGDGKGQDFVDGIEDRGPRAGIAGADLSTAGRDGAAGVSWYNAGYGAAGTFIYGVGKRLANWGGPSLPNSGYHGPGHYAQGTDYVPNTGPAFLHQGEMVIPADIAEQWRAGESLSRPDTGGWLGMERTAASRSDVGGRLINVQATIVSPYPLSPGHGQALGEEIAPHVWRALERAGKVLDD